MTPSDDFLLDPDNALTQMTQALEGVCAPASAKEIAELTEAFFELDNVLMGVTPAAVGVAVRRALRYALSWEGIDFEVIRGLVISPMVNVTLDRALVEDVIARKRKPSMRLWEWNDPQVVIGSFQPYQNEIQSGEVERHGILVSYRVTDGGTMFMEPGNCITYSLVAPTALVEGMSFEQSYPLLDQWVIEVLEKVGIRAEHVPFNDIVSEAGKISGTAQKH